MLKLENLSFQYNHFSFSLKNINLILEPGDFLGIFGFNSSGKSTLLKIITGIIPEYESGDLSGNISFNNENLLHIPINSRSGIAGIIFQDPVNQFFFSDLEDEFRFVLRNNGFSEDETEIRTVECLDKVGLTSYLHSDPNHLSYGQRKLALLGLNLALNPEILILDEIFSSLDSESKEKITQVILDYRKTGKIIINVDREIRNHKLANKVIWLDNGIIKYSGDSNNFFEISEIQGFLINE